MLPLHSLLPDNPSRLHAAVVYQRLAAEAARSAQTNLRLLLEAEAGGFEEAAEEHRIAALAEQLIADGLYWDARSAMWAAA